jgi:predicted amidohydrolase YtcJ
MAKSNPMKIDLIMAARRIYTLDEANSAVECLAVKN